MGISRSNSSSDSAVSSSSSVSNGKGERELPILPRRGPSDEGDFEPVKRPTRQANILIYGAEKHGKTTFCTRYAPTPIRVLSLDGRAEDAVYEAQQMGRDVKRANLFMPEEYINLSREEVKRVARDLLGNINKNFMIALEKSRLGQTRTILVDTVTELAEICKLAFDGTIEKVKEHSHGEPQDFANREIWWMANQARKYKSAHLIFTARMSEIWKDQKPTGYFKPQCPKATIAAVDWAAQIRLKTSFGKPIGEFEMEVTSAGTDISQLGEVYDASLWDIDPFEGPFVYACCQNYKDSEPDDWK